jgi:hypothetical protein
MPRSPRVIALGAALCGVLATAGCGAKSEPGRAVQATTEGSYLEVGGLKYQVQISRALSPSDAEDRDYLIGLPSGVKPAPDEIWFAIFMRVENDGSRAEKATGDYTITDTQGDTFRPIPLSGANAFAYRPRVLQPGDLIPLADSAAASDPIQGSLVLFKLKTADLQNRPLVLHISQGGASGQSASVEIDL